MFPWWNAYLLPILGSCVVSAVSAVSIEVCEETSCHQPEDNIHRAVLMQRRKEHRVVAPAERDAGPGAVRLFLSELQGLAQRKGIDGLDPEEVQHVQTIKGLIADTIIPSIFEGAEEARQEIAELYEAVVNCTQRATPELAAESTIHTEVEQNRDDHKECRKLEDDTFKEKDRVCRQFNITRTSIDLPAGEMPGLDADDATMIQYLKDMDEYFCGRMQVFKDQWDECEELTKNYTDIHDHCVTLQQDLEDNWCTWMSELEGTCGGMEECWESTVARFTERKTAIDQLVEEKKEALEAALKVQCLWDAWEWDREPCTVNETKVKECNDLKPNTTDIEVDIPSPPQRHPCNMSADGFFPCSEAFIGSEYASIDVSQALIDEMRDACSACPPRPVWPTPVWGEPEDVELDHMKHVEGTTYMTSRENINTRRGYTTPTLRRENVRGMMFSLSDNINDRFRIELYTMWRVATVTIHRSKKLVVDVIPAGARKRRRNGEPRVKNAWPYKVDDVVSIVCSGDMFKLKLKDEIVFETGLVMPPYGFLAKVVLLRASMVNPELVDIAFDIAGVQAGVPNLFGIEKVGASSYKATGVALPFSPLWRLDGGEIEAKDVVGVTFTSAKLEMECRTGDTSRTGYPEVVEVLLDKLRMDARYKTYEYARPIGSPYPRDLWNIEESDTNTFDASGKYFLFKRNGNVMSASLNFAPTTGFRTVWVRFSDNDALADIAFDFASSTPTTTTTTTTGGASLTHMEYLGGTVYVTTLAGESKARMFMDNVRGMTLRLPDTKTRTALYFEAAQKNTLHLKVKDSKLTADMMPGAIFRMSEVKTVEVEDVKDDSVISFSLTGDMLKLTVNDAVVFEGLANIPLFGWHMMVWPLRYRPHLRVLDMAVDVAGLNAGVPNLYGIERHGTSYKVTGAALPGFRLVERGEIQAKDVLGLTFSTNANSFQYRLKAGDGREVTIGQHEKTMLTVRFDYPSEAWTGEHFSVQTQSTSAPINVAMSGDDMVIKIGGTEFTRAAKIVGAEGFNLVKVYMYTLHDQADIVFDFASGQRTDGALVP